MANDEHLQTLLAAISSGDWSRWNQWRKDNPNLPPELRGADLHNADLRLADLSAADLKCAQLQCADLTGANLTGADLRFANLRGTNFTNARLTNATVEPSALRLAINPRLDVAEPKGVRWNRVRGGKLLPYAAAYERLRDLIKAGRSRLSKLAPGLFEHEELVTLGLSQREESKNNQPTGRDTQPQPPVKPVENRK